MGKKVAITAAITGAIHTPSMSPYLPVTLEEIATEAIESAKEGAAEVHIHARDPKSGHPSSDLSLFSQIIEKIKEKSDVIICLTTGGGQGMTVEERVSVVPEYKPELASLNMGSMNFGMFPLAEKCQDWKYEWEKPFLERTRDFVFRNTFSDLERILSIMRDNGTKPELEVYDAGSDVLAMKTRAVQDGDFYVLNGRKTFITNGPVGDLFLVYARTDPKARGKGITAFVVEKGFDGFTSGKKLEKMGWRGSPTGDLIFEDCRVPSENIIGEVNGGVKILMSGLNSERLLLAAESLGLGRACLEDSVQYARERVQFGKRIADLQMVMEKLARMATKVEAVKAMVWSQAFKMSENGPAAMTMETAAAKLLASEMALQNALDATQIFGGYGYIREFPVERYLRDARIMTIGGGTSEIMCQVIFRELEKGL